MLGNSMTRFAFLPLLPLLLLAGCATLDSHTEPKVNLASYQHLFVEHVLADGNGVDQVIARELRARGYDANSGPLTLLPDNAQLLVRYDDRWNYDFSNYMIELNLIVQTVDGDRRLATAHYHRPTLGKGSTVEMVDTVLDKLFPRKN